MWEKSNGLIDADRENKAVVRINEWDEVEPMVYKAIPKSNQPNKGENTHTQDVLDSNDQF